MRRWDASVAVVSDYRYHGVSLSNGKAALQASARLTLDNGLFVGSFASTIADNGGSDIELDLELGQAFEAGALEGAVGVVAYVYPGADDANYAETYALVTYPLSHQVRLGAEIRYAPVQNSLATDNIALMAMAEIAVSPNWTVTTVVGHEDGVYDRKRHWSLGAERAFGPASVGLTWTGFDEAGLRDEAWVAALTLNF